MKMFLSTTPWLMLPRYSTKISARAWQPFFVLGRKDCCPARFDWYDLSVRSFEQRFAGRVETGKESFTDPYMGGG
jgi:hypothetical protein